MSILKRLRTVFALYPLLIWVLATGNFLNASGMAFLWPLNSLYIHDHLGKPLTVAAIVLLLNSGGSVLGQLTGGVLFDRIGARVVMLTGIFTSAIFIALPGLFSNWPLYVAVMLLYGFTGALAFPAIQALVAKSWPQGGRRAFNFLYVANNAGVAVGSAVGGLVAQHSFQLAFLSAAVMLFLYGIWAAFMIHDRPVTDGVAPDAAEAVGGAAIPAASVPAASVPGAGGASPDSVRLPDTTPWPSVIALFVGITVAWMVYVQWQGAIAVFMTGRGIPLRSYSFLWTLNGLLILFGQPLVSLVVRHVRTYGSQLALGTVLFMASFGVISLAQQYELFIVGMVLLTFGEMLMLPVIPAAVAAVSPPSQRGFLQGLVGSGGSTGRMLGPLLGGLLFDHTSFSTLLIVMIGMLFIPVVCYGFYGYQSRQLARMGFGAAGD